MRKWPWRIIWICAGIALGLYLVIGVLLAGKNLPAIPPINQPVVLSHGHLSNQHTQKKTWTFDYDHATLSPDQSFATLEGVHDGIIYRKGKPYLKIAAERVSVNTNSLDFTATGKVHVTRIGKDASTSFDTDLIVWNNAQKLLRLDHPSYVHTDGQTLKVESIVVDANEDSVLFGKVDGEIGS